MKQMTKRIVSLVMMLTMDEFKAEFRTVDTTEYVYRIRIRDVNGNWHETEILPLA